MRPRRLVCLGLACAVWLAVPTVQADPPGSRYGSIAEGRHEAQRHLREPRPSRQEQFRPERSRPDHGRSRQAHEPERWRGADRHAPPRRAESPRREHYGRGWAPPHPGWTPPRHGWEPPRHHRWSRGDRLPPGYLQPRYVVHDWQHRRYSHPPRGYQWLRVDGQVLLVGIATGLILQSLLTD